MLLSRANISTGCNLFAAVHIHRHHTCCPQVKYEDRPDDVVAVISNCNDMHKVSRLTYLKEMVESTPDLKVRFYGSCSPNGHYGGSKDVC